MWGPAVLQIFSVPASLTCIYLFNASNWHLSLLKLRCMVFSVTNNTVTTAQIGAQTHNPQFERQTHYQLCPGPIFTNVLSLNFRLRFLTVWSNQSLLTTALYSDLRYLTFVRRKAGITTDQFPFLCPRIE